jgi:hypothetical protein
MPKYLLSANRREGRIAHGYWEKNGNFHPFYLKRCISVYFYKAKELWTIFRTLSSSSPIFLLFTTIQLLAKIKLVQQSL